MHSWAPCQCKNGAAAVGAGQKFLRMQGAGGEILRVRASWPGPGPAGRLPWRARRSMQAGRPGERLSPASGPLRSTRPEETRRQMRRPPLRPAQARMTSQKQPGPRRPETAATSPPGLHRPGMAATRPGPIRFRAIAAQAHHRGPRRLPRRGSLADRAARRSAGCHPYPCKKGSPLHMAFQTAHRRVCCSLPRQTIRLHALRGLHASPCCLKSAPLRFAPFRGAPHMPVACAVQGGFYSFFYVFGQEKCCLSCRII